MASQDPPPSLSSDIERADAGKTVLPLNEEERMDLHRLTEDTREYRRQLARMAGGTEPASARAVKGALRKAGAGRTGRMPGSKAADKWFAEVQKTNGEIALALREANGYAGGE